MAYWNPIPRGKIWLFFMKRKARYTWHCSGLLKPDTERKDLTFLYEKESYILDIVVAYWNTPPRGKIWLFFMKKKAICTWYCSGLLKPVTKRKDLTFLYENESYILDIAVAYWNPFPTPGFNSSFSLNLIGLRDC